MSSCVSSHIVAHVGSDVVHERLPIPVNSRSSDLLTSSRKFSLPLRGISGRSPVDRSKLSSVHADGD